MSDPETAILSERYRKLGEEVIKSHPDLFFINQYGIKVGYMVSDKEKRKSGRAVFADCRKVQDYWKSQFVPYDFLITVYQPNCDAARFSDEQFHILMYHELLHVGAEMDKKGNIKLSIVPHDIEDFAVILKEHGLGWQLTGLLDKSQVNDAVHAGEFVNELLEGDSDGDEEVE